MIRNKKKIINPASRAKLFIPFDAMKGFKEALKEREKIKVDKIVLSNEDEEVLSKSILKLKKGHMTSLTYFDSDEYISIKGMISEIDYTYKYLVVVTTKINFEDILKIEDDNLGEEI